MQGEHSLCSWSRPGKGQFVLARRDIRQSLDATVTEAEANLECLIRSALALSPHVHLRLGQSPVQSGDLDESLPKAFLHPLEGAFAVVEHRGACVIEHDHVLLAVV